MRIFLSAILAILPDTLIAATALDGIWVLDGPGTESEILLTEEGERLRIAYDLLEDDPSLYCTPASVARIWANPGSRVEIEQDEEHILISYELFDLRREIPFIKSSIADFPSTKNLEGTEFAQMGSSVAWYEGDRLIIESTNHIHGYIRTSRGIPQGSNTHAREELEVDGDILHITHTYTDASLFEQPLILQYSFNRLENVEIERYNCTDADYDWFIELNLHKEDQT